MKIAHVCQYYLPEFGYQEVYLPRAQASMGHHVTVFTTNVADPHHSEHRYDLGQFMHEGVAVVRLPSVRLATRRALRGLLSEIRKTDPDWIIVHGVFSAVALQVLAGAVSGLVNAFITVDDHTTGSTQRKTIPARLLYRLFRWILAPIIQGYFTDFVAVTPETVDILKREMGIRRAPVRRISLGADCER